MPQGLGRGYPFMGKLAVPLEPSVKRAIAFVDGQNLFCAVREAFGYSEPEAPEESVPERAR